VYSFHYLTDGHALLRKLVQEFQLCPKLCHLQQDAIPCEGIRENYCKGACEHKETAKAYNRRVKKACDSLQQQPSFAIIDKGISSDDHSCILMENGHFYGMGYIPAGTPVQDPVVLKEYLTMYRENSFIRNLVNGYAARFPGKVHLFS
jgi:DNA polymerase III subunit epsilon